MNEDRPVSNLSRLQPEILEAFTHLAVLAAGVEVLIVSVDGENVFFVGGGVAAVPGCFRRGERICYAIPWMVQVQFEFVGKAGYTVYPQPF